MCDQKSQRGFLSQQGGDTLGVNNYPSLTIAIVSRNEFSHATLCLISHTCSAKADFSLFKVEIQGHRKHRRTGKGGGGTCLQGHFWIKKGHLKIKWGNFEV